MKAMSTSTGNIFDVDNYTDAISDAGDAIADVATSAWDAAADAGHEIGAVLKAIAPIISMVPGFGTLVGVAFYAAGALAAADPITDAVLGAAGVAVPAGVPRIAFNGAVNVSKDVVKGKNAFGSIVNTCREAAAQAGGDKAVGAFDTGLSLARGNKLDQAAIDAGRANLGDNWTAVVAYDAAVGIARNESADEVLLGVARDYVATQGGPVAAAAFDAGIALAHGQALQEAGWVALKAFAKGNSVATKVLAFLDAMQRGIKSGLDLQTILQTDLARELQGYLGQKLGGVVEASGIKQALQPYLDAIKADPKWLDKMPLDMVYAKVGGAVFAKGDEVLARAAQAIMRGGDVDEKTFLALTGTQFVGTFDYSEKSVLTNDQWEAKGKTIAESNAHWKNHSLRNILNGEYFYITLGVMSALTQQIEFQTIKAQILDDRQRRGFLVALGVCEGKSLDGHGQQEIRNSLGDARAWEGFDWGQQIQFDRTAENAPATFKAQVHDFIKQTAPNLTQLPTISKAQERAKWVAYYTRLASPTSATMTG